jgi:uncharacterized protein YodC (DUF2158 family)
LDLAADLLEAGSQNQARKVFYMSTFSRSVSIAFAVAFGIALSFSSTNPAFAQPGLPDTTMQGSAAIRLHSGDLVRFLSGGPLMTVTMIHGDQIDCSWTDWDGQLRSQSFPIADLEGPITTPPLDPNLEQEVKADDRNRKTCPSGTLNIYGEFKCPR